MRTQDPVQLPEPADSVSGNGCVPALPERRPAPRRVAGADMEIRRSPDRHGRAEHTGRGGPRRAVRRGARTVRVPRVTAACDGDSELADRCRPNGALLLISYTR